MANAVSVLYDPGELLCFLVWLVVLPRLWFL